MKTIYTLIIAILLLSSSTQAQHVLLSENFSNSSQANVVPSVAGAWITKDGALYTRQHSGNETPALIRANVAKPVSALDADLRVRWTGYREANGGLMQQFDSEVFLCYKIGSNGVVRKVKVDAANTLNTEVNNEVTIPLSDNYQYVHIYFETTTAKGYSYRIDNLEILAFPNMFKWSTRALGENPFVVSAPKAATAYLLNEATMSWTMTKEGSVTHETVAVSNTQHPRTNQSFSIVQAGASKTEGTHIKIQFSAMMADVSFNILDIDRTMTTNQFKDSVVVTGVNNAGKVVLATSSFVRNSANTAFNPKASSFVGLNDVNNSTDQGDVTVVFTEEIKEINISYYNQGRDKGRQAISIGNFNGYQTASPLPVELAWFKGAMQGNTTQLTWSTASEVNNEKFIVERSQDGRSFSKIGEVAGRGNSSVIVAYAFTDTNPASGTNYYRLRQVDFDGAEEFSKIVAVQLKGKYGLSGGIVKVYPTLAASEVNVSLDLSNAQVAVLDASGRQLSQHSVASQSLVLPVTHLQPGVYFVKVYNGQQQETHRFVKQ